LETASPGWSGTHLGSALTTAAEQFADESTHAGLPRPCEAVLISDLQEGAKLDGLQGHDWPNGIRVIVERVDATRRGNAGLEVLDTSSGTPGDGRAASARVVNTRDSNREKFRLNWKAGNESATAGSSTEIYLPPGQTRTVAAPELPKGATTGALRLTGDEEDFDNSSYFAAPEIKHATIAYFGSESANDPEHLRYYLQRAFPEAARREVEVASAVSNGVFSLPVLKNAALAVIPGGLDPPTAKAVHEWMAGGNTALLVLSNAQSGTTLAALYGGPEIETAEATGDYALFGQIDFTHPIFAAFADPRFSDFSRIHFWKHRRWTIPPNIPARVLAKFDDDAPALTQITVGKGNLLVLAAGWNPADSQFAVSSKFLPLMQTMLDWSGGAAPARTQFQIGETIPAPAWSGEDLQWRKPDGKIVSLAAGRPFPETDLPGIYRVTAASNSWTFAVNLPLDESRTAPLSADDLARLGVPLQSTAEFDAAKSPEARRLLQHEELENRQKPWRWLILGLLALAFVEIVLGGSLARRVKTVEVAP